MQYLHLSLLNNYCHKWVIQKSFISNGARSWLFGAMKFPYNCCYLIDVYYCNYTRCKKANNTLLFIYTKGTCRMGAKDDGRSVVDENSRVWAYENLFIGSCGVIPTGTACNPTNTAMALAINSCRYILHTFGGKVDMPFKLRSTSSL